MKKLFESMLLTLLASSTGNELAQQVQYLKAENEILRSKLPAKITVTPRERLRLLKYAKPLGDAIKLLVSIVTPRTFLRWLRGEKTKKGKAAEKQGRPRTPEEIRELILKMAQETGWGYTRIHGELKKLQIKVSRTTVANILRGEGIEPGPKRGEGTWADFISRHVETLWACDFFSKKVLTCSGVVEVFVLFFIHIGSRRVHVTAMTTNPDAAWVAQQARNFAILREVNGQEATYLIRDLESKFTAQFDAIMESEDIQIVRVGPKAPNLNAFAERLCCRSSRSVWTTSSSSGRITCDTASIPTCSIITRNVLTRVWATVRWVRKNRPTRSRCLWVRSSASSGWVGC